MRVSSFQGALAALLAACAGQGLDERGCPLDPSCSDRAQDGAYCLGPCDGRCQRDHFDFGLWVTVYGVAGSVGLGRHQGLALFGARTVFDDRFSLSEDQSLADLAWPPGPWFPAIPADVEEQLLHGSPFSDHPMCAPPALELDRPFYDHGRAMSRAPEHRDHRVQLEHFDGDDLEKVAACLDDVTDGYCDSVCGNCSYVLPSPVVADSRRGDWSEDVSRVWGDSGCSPDEAYYGGPGQMSQPSFLGYRFSNPFTHCAWQGCTEQWYEAPTIDSYAGFNDSVISGLYGHNSNADAEAAYRAFQHCVDPDRYSEGEACAACGAGGGGRQSPCANQSNTAATYWERTSSSLDDKVSVIESGSGPTGGAPVCRWAAFEVRGM